MWGVLVTVLVLLFIAGHHWSRVLIKSRTFQFYGNSIHRLETDQKIVALTFDDGPHPETTTKILDILKRNDVKATFFLVGKNMAANPQLAKDVAQSGNEIGNHSYDHRGMSLLSSSEVADEIEKTDAEIAKTGYTAPTHFRPPYGDKLLSLPHYLSKHDRKTIMWSINPDDHPPEELNVNRILTTVLSNIEPGSIIILHPEYKHRQSSLDAIEPIIVNLKKLGYTFVTVSELLEHQ